MCPNPKLRRTAVPVRLYQAVGKMIWFIFFVFLSNSCFAFTEIVPNPIVAINLTPLGFHRELYYTIYFDYPIAGKDCEFYLEQEFSAAVYVNRDQLDNLKRLGKV